MDRESERRLLVQFLHKYPHQGFPYTLHATIPYDKFRLYPIVESDLPSVILSIEILDRSLSRTESAVPAWMLWTAACISQTQRNFGTRQPAELSLLGLA